MTDQSSRGRTDVDPAQLQARIKYLSALGEREFNYQFGDFVRRPSDLEMEAFHSDELAERSMRTLRYLTDNARTELEHATGEKKRGYKLFREALRREERLLHLVVNGLRARTGRVPIAPNPRGRAMRRLAAKHPVEFLELVREEQAADELRKKMMKLQNRAVAAGWPRGSVAAAVELIQKERRHPPTWTQFQEVVKEMDLQAGGRGRPSRTRG